MNELLKENKSTLSERTPYLKELASRRKNCKTKIEEIKATLFVDKIFGKDVMFKRNYAVFSYNRPNLRKSEQHSLHFRLHHRYNCYRTVPCKAWSPVQRRA